MIQFKDVTKVYPGSASSLSDITLTISSGEFVSIVGPSGSGKTTLIKLLLAEEAPTKGTVHFDSVDINRLRRYQIPKHRRRIGVVFQDFRLLSDKTAYENIAFAMEAAGYDDKEIAADVPYVLDLVDLSELKFRFPKELSGGELQRLAIARAIITQPEVIVADEPTGNLDPIATHEVIQILKKVNDLGTTVVLATHDKQVVDSLKKRVVTLEKGRIVRDEEKGKYIIE
jgi:cell division transport system ATP-binding protein